MPRSPGRVFYDRLQELLSEAGFDAFVEETCKPFYAPKMGAQSLQPGRYFRTHSAISKVSPANAASSGAVRIQGRLGISYDLGAGTRFPTIPGCRRHAADCHMKFTRRCSTLFVCIRQRPPCFTVTFAKVSDLKSSVKVDLYAGRSPRQGRTAPAVVGRREDADHCRDTGTWR